jgi:hypothetical protein
MYWKLVILCDVIYFMMAVKQLSVWFLLMDFDDDEARQRCLLV